MIIKWFYSILQSNRNSFFFLFFYRLFKLILNFIYPIYAYLFPNISHRKVLKSLNVNLTTFPPRIKSLHIVLSTLFRQTFKPNKIILWIAKEDFPSLKSLPIKVLAFSQKGLLIRYLPNFKSHKKYYGAFKYYSKNINITVDDDTFYPEDFIENMYKTYLEFPECITCNFALEITTSKGKFNEYKKWSNKPSFSGPSFNIIPIGCEGVLYPPNSLSKDVLKFNTFMLLCPTADDIWLKFMSTIKNTPIKLVSNKQFTFINLFAAKISPLNFINSSQKGNDNQFNKLLEKYPIFMEKIIK
jgi:hypothetical protein